MNKPGRSVTFLEDLRLVYIPTTIVKPVFIIYEVDA